MWERSHFVNPGEWDVATLAKISDFQIFIDSDKIKSELLYDIYCYWLISFLHKSTMFKDQNLLKYTIEESYFKTQYLQKYENGVNTRFLYKILRRICSRCPFFSKQYSSLSKMSLNFGILIKTQYLRLNLSQNTITPRYCPKNRWIFFSPNKPILQLECMNSKMFLPLYSLKRTGKRLL